MHICINTTKHIHLHIYKHTYTHQLVLNWLLPRGLPPSPTSVLNQNGSLHLCLLMCGLCIFIQGWLSLCLTPSVDPTA